MGSVRNPTSKKQKQERKELLGVSFRPENFIPGLIIGFIFGFFLDLSKPAKSPSGRKIGSSPTSKNQQQTRIVSSNNDEELKMVLVVRQDLKMGFGKIASQCAHCQKLCIFPDALDYPVTFVLVFFALIWLGEGCGTNLQQQISSEAMGALWASQNNRYMQKPARNE